MSIDAIKEALPEYAKDLKLNLGSIARSTELTEQQLWGALVATAAATKSEQLLREISEDALDVLSEEAYHAALGAASIMGMNNVFYRTKHQLDGRYDDLRAGLRMNIIGNPGWPRPTSSCGRWRCRRSTVVISAWPHTRRNCATPTCRAR